MTRCTPHPTRWLSLSLALLLSGCVPGCGGDAPPERPSTPVRLAPGIGGEDRPPPAPRDPESALPPPTAEALADPPPVEPPP